MSGDDDKISSLAVARFNRDRRTEAHDPVTALDAAKEWIAECEEKPDHVIVLVGRTTKDGASATRYFQAGQYKFHAQYGLVMVGGNMILQDGRDDD